MHSTENIIDPVRKILCVEDNLDSCEVITKLIENSGAHFRVTAVHDTEAALALIASERFDLYILDTWVPQMGGLQLCKRIRENDQLTPILFFTAIDSSANMKKALAAGANAFLTKACDLDELVPTVKRLLGTEATENA